MIKKSFQTVCLLIMLSILISSVAYAFIYETKTHNITQTIKKTWYDPGWQYRKSITIQGSQVADPNTHSLNATGGYMNIGSANWGSVTGTISFWIKWDSVSNRPWGQHDNMETRFSGSRLILDWGASGSLTSGTSFFANKWYFIAIVWNESTDKLYLYVGDENNPPVLDAQNNAWTSTVSTVGVTQNNFMASKGGVNPTDGKGDDLRYWNTDRTLAAIQSDYNIELTASETNLRSYFKLNNDFDDIGPNNNDGSGVGSYQFSTSVPSMGTYLSNFPVLISLTDSDLANDAQDDGDDILFTLANKKTKISHEIEDFNGTTGKLIAWVKIPILFANNNTLIYMYYGNAGVSSQQDTINVWDSNYMGVWHLGETSGGAKAIKDSTLNNNAGTDSGNPTLKADGIAGRAVSFDGVDDFISVTNSQSLQLTNSLTLEAWIKLTSFGSGSDVDIILRKGEGNPNNYQLAVNDQKLGLMIEENDGAGLNSSSSLSASTWFFVAGTWNGATRIVYLNGSQSASGAKTGSIVPDTRALYIGGRSGTDLSTGIIDEARISNIARSPSWIMTQYNNQKSPSTFYTVGLEETM